MEGLRQLRAMPGRLVDALDRFDRVAAPPALPGWLDIAGLLALVLLVRLPSFLPAAIDWDESLFALIARAMLEGHLPYVAVYDTKPLGPFIEIAASMAIFGRSLFAVRAAGLLSVLASTLLLRALARAAGLSRAAAFAAAGLYAAFSVTLGGTATDTEILLAPFTIAAALVAARAQACTDPAGRLRAAAGMGLLVGLATWMKYVPALPGSALFAMLLLAWAWRQPRPRTVLGPGLAFVAAAALPTLASGLAYLLAGQWQAFWFCNFGMMAGYARLPGLSPYYSLVRYVDLTFPLLLLAALGVARRRRQTLPPLATLLWFAAELAAAAAPRKFWMHYFLMTLPPLCLLAAMAIDRAPGRHGLSRMALVVGLAAGLWVVGLQGWKQVEAGPGPERRAAALIRQAQPTGASLWVVNADPMLYLLSGAAVPTRFPFPPDLLGHEAALIPADPDGELSRIMAAAPEIVVTDPGGWTYLDHARRARIEAFIAGHYRLAARLAQGGRVLEIYRRAG